MTANRFADGWFYRPSCSRRTQELLRTHLKGAYLRALQENEPQYLLAGLQLWMMVEYAYQGDYRDIGVVCGILSLSRDTIRDWLDRFREGDAIEVQVTVEHGVIVGFNLAKIQ